MSKAKEISQKRNKILELLIEKLSDNRLTRFTDYLFKKFYKKITIIKSYNDYDGSTNEELKKSLKKDYARFRQFLFRAWGNCISFIEKNIVVFILLLIYLIFHNYWEDQICKIIEHDIFSGVKKSILTDTLFIIGVSYCFIKYVIRTLVEGKCQTTINFLFGFIIFGFWLYYSSISDRFSFTGLYKLENIKYLDIIPVFVMCRLFSYIYDKMNTPNYENNVDTLKLQNIFSNDGYSRDIPIIDEKNDLLRRSADAINEIEKILKTDTSNESFSYGLHSSWGSGKTSFMNLMKGHLAKEYSDSCIKMDFNPWLFSKEKDLVTLFFDELSKLLKPFDKSLAESIIDYSNALSSVAAVSNEFRIISEIFDLTHRIKQSKSKTLEEKVSHIKQSIIKINKKIVVFVDDIDRLDSNELLEMLKLIRNISDFPKMFFIVAYDKSYLINILKKTFSGNEIDFTEKIFQAEFHLPRISAEDLKRLLLNELSNHISNLKDIQEINNCIYGINSNVITDTLTTLRDLRRFSNSFITSYSKLEKSIIIRDLFYLEIIRVKFPTIYTLLEEKKNDFFHTIKKTIRFIPSQRSGNSALMEFIDLNQKDLSITRIHIDTIEKILLLLFDHEETGYLRINHTYYINRYFSLSTNDIPLNYFNDVINDNSLSSIKRFIKVWLQYYPQSLKTRLQELIPKNEKEKEKIIKIFIYLISIDTEMSYETDEITSYLRSLINRSKQGKKKLINIIKESGYSPSLNKYLFEIDNNPQFKKSDVLLTREETAMIRSYFLSDCITSTSTKPINETTIFACYKETAMFDFISQNNYHITNVLFDNPKYNINNSALLKDYITKHFTDCIPFFFKIDTQPDASVFKNLYAINTLPVMLWDHWIEFYNFVQSIINPDKKTTEFQQFLKKYDKMKQISITWNFQYIKFDVLSKEKGMHLIEKEYYDIIMDKINGNVKKGWRLKG